MYTQKVQYLFKKLMLQVIPRYRCIHIKYLVLVQTLQHRFQKHTFNSFTSLNDKGKDKAVMLQAWSGPEGSSKLRFPDFMTTTQDGGKVVSLMHKPPLPPGNTPGTHFC